MTVNLAIATGFATVLVLWDLFGRPPLPLGVVGAVRPEMQRPYMVDAAAGRWDLI